jgi:hypothetical protein
MPAPDLGGAPILVMKNDQPVEPAKPGPTTNGPLDIAGMLFDVLGLYGISKDILKIIPRIAGFFTTGALGPALLTGTGIAAAFSAILFGSAALADYIEEQFGIRKKFAELEKTVEYQEQRLAGQKAAEKTAGGPGGPQGRADRTEQRANIIKKFGLKMGDLSQDPNDINIMVHKDGRKFDLTTGEVVPGTVSSTPNYSPRATTPSAPDATSSTSRRKANLPQIQQAPETTGAPTPAANKSNFTPRPNAERNFTPRPPASTGGASEGEVKAEQKKETGDSKITGTNKFHKAHGRVKTSDEIAEFEGTKSRSMQDLARQQTKLVDGVTSDRGTDEDTAIIEKLQRGERVDPNSPPPTMTKRELASRIAQYGGPALRKGAYTPEEYKLITKQAGQYQWQTNAQQTAGEWIKRESAAADMKKVIKPLAPAPVVMNNSSTTNSSSSSGGEGNNVAGQNFPLSAINPHIQEFLQKQNMQYQ